MARIRSIKPELRTDLTVAGWPREVRYAWVLLWGYCDDKGRGIDDLRLLTSDLFPLDRDVTERKLNGWLQRFTDSGRVCRYEVDGHRFLHVVNWHHQKINRPTPSRLPPCPVHGGPDERSMNRSLHDSVNGSVNGSRIDSVSDSLHDSSPSRAPADQGAGSRDQGSREQVSHATETAMRTGAQQLVAEWLDHTPKRPPNAVIGQVGKQLAALLAEGQDPDDLRRALAAWTTKGLHPSTLPSVVHEVANSSRTNGRPSASALAAQAALDAGARVAARHATQGSA